MQDSLIFGCIYTRKELNLYERQRRRPSCALTQSGQRVWQSNEKVDTSSLSLVHNAKPDTSITSSVKAATK